MSSDIPKFVVCEVCRLRVEACKCEQPPQPGDGVWVRAVYVGGYIEGMGDVTFPTLHSFARVDDKMVLALPLAAIHPAPPASPAKPAKKGE